VFLKGKKPTILITGASGFIGRYFLDVVKEKYSVIAVARRSSTEAGVPFHPNIRWVQWNISNKLRYNEVMGYLIGSGGVDVVIHLAGFYDYEYNENTEYEQTNIIGTRNVLELSRQLDVKHFVFASSLAACKFPVNGKIVNEESLPDADFAYARSKKAGEEMCESYSKYFKCSVVRFAAVFSDYCEYTPLFQFISTWLSGKWDSRILGGKGESAITYIHIHDLIRLLFIMIEKHKDLPQFGKYIASPDGSVSHKDLFYVTTRDYYGAPENPSFMPRHFIMPGIIVKKALGKLHLVSKPFEKLWMVKYVDIKLNVDSTKTRQLLDWEPTPRYHILRRMIYLLDKLKSQPNEWMLKNEAAKRKDPHRPSLAIYEQLIQDEGLIEKKILDYILGKENSERFPNYQRITVKEFRMAISSLYHLLLASVRSAERSLMQHYIDEIALNRFTSGFEVKEMTDAISSFGEIIMSHLASKEEMKGMRQNIYDTIGLTLQLAIDEIEDVYENLDQKISIENFATIAKKREIERSDEIRKLSAFYQEYREEA
jgi:nucleoside-diphosphate-sugar epimerase